MAAAGLVAAALRAEVAGEAIRRVAAEAKPVAVVAVTRLGVEEALPELVLQFTLRVVEEPYTFRVAADNRLRAIEHPASANRMSPHVFQAAERHTFPGTPESVRSRHVALVPRRERS